MNESWLRQKPKFKTKMLFKILMFHSEQSIQIIIQTQRNNILNKQTQFKAVSYTHLDVYKRQILYHTIRHTYPTNQSTKRNTVLK